MWGLTFIHYAVVVAKGAEGNFFLDWLGGYSETNWSVNPIWTAQFQNPPAHAAAAGISVCTIQDEWYFHMRFRTGMQRIAPLLSAHPSAKAVEGPDSTHGSNPDVRAAVAAGEIRHVARISENPGRGRGIGFTGAHYHKNRGDAQFQKTVLNAMLWTAGGEIPAAGVPALELPRRDRTGRMPRGKNPSMPRGRPRLRAHGNFPGRFGNCGDERITHDQKGPVHRLAARLLAIPLIGPIPNAGHRPASRIQLVKIRPDAFKPQACPLELLPGGKLLVATRRGGSSANGKDADGVYETLREVGKLPSNNGWFRAGASQRHFRHG